MDAEIRIERVLPATIGRVYDAWTRAELLARWYCPNPKLDLKVQADVRVGGEYVVEMGPHVVRGSYLEVQPPSRLVFSWKWEGTEDEPTRVEVELTEVADGTRMVLSHTGFANAEDAANHQLGWDPELTRLADLLESVTAPQPDPAVDRG
ncbi:SRPBCC family protein [Kribbella jiaozuonensis]|uniref:SRPBCC domain-containing protein n=1 Tax=Kribbella jiaozuonensis TaxID=2575441 RepID=A0A4U3LIM5_9ACTN|nr:SRPBCC domain-containing protein [Kribbella jiaozuonensis]TKK75498.1 SRPBCC domain-containing protein [Kribbella jiaozuonensis]